MNNSFQFVYSNCHYCHSEEFIGDLINKICPSCRKNPFKTDKFKCYICKFSSDKKKDLNLHYSDNLHKQNVVLIKQWLLQ